MNSAENLGIPGAAQAEVERIIAMFRLELSESAGSPSQEAGPLAIDEIMRRIDVALGIAQGAATAREAEVLPAWTPAQPILALRRAYAVHELLQFDDAMLVENGYRVILGRSPDPAGSEHYLMLLRTGAMSKVSFLAALRWSPEGVNRGVHVDGLLLPYLFDRLESWPVVGQLFGWARGLARLHTLSKRLELARHSQAREWQALGAAHNQLVQVLEDKLSAVHAQQGEMLSRLDALTDESVRSLDALRSAREMLASHEQRLDEVSRASGTIQKTLASHEQKLGEVSRISGSMQKALQDIALANAQRAKEELARDQLKDARRHALDPMYSRFENHFRGTEEEIRRRAEAYLQVVRVHGIGDAGSPVIDVGSGRGEWLDVLRHAGLHAFGIDSNRTFVAECSARGLEVKEGDALDMMASLPAASAGAVTSMHLVEHLPFETLVELLDQAHRILRPGGALLLETPNPENINVGSHWFYLDPTHRNPIPPAMLAWLVEERGFARVQVLPQYEDRSFVKPELLPEDIPGATQINRLLAGYRAAPDYTVLAWRE